MTRQKKTPPKIPPTEAREAKPLEAQPPEKVLAMPLIAHFKAILEIFAGRVVDAVGARRRATSAAQVYGRRMEALVHFAPRTYYDTPSYAVRPSQYDSFLDSAEAWSFGQKLTLQAAESQVVLKCVATAFVDAYRQAEKQLGKLVAYKILRLIDSEARMSGSFDPPEWPVFLGWIESLGVDLIFIKKEL
jgi:hypothetical protein